MRSAPSVPAFGVPAPDQPRQLVLFKFDSCPYCKVVMASLAELGIQPILRDTRTDPDARREHRARTGRTQVPCLYIDDEPLFESADIVRWLEVYAARDA